MSDYIAITRALLEALLAPVVALVTQVFYKQSSPKDFKTNLIFRLVRAVTSNVPTLRLQSMGGLVENAYNDWTKAQKQAPEVVSLAADTKVMWVGDKNAKYTLLYFHGGGYTAAGMKVHFELSRKAVLAAERAGRSVAVLHVQYTLAPGAKYPRQLEQAITALNYIQKELHKQPRYILLGGDSAGGHLSLSLLSHLTHPHPKLQPIELKDKLAGVIMISPWVTFQQTARAFQNNSGRDILDARALKSWSDQFLVSAPTDPYNDPLSAKPDWWREVPARKICMTAGGDELFVDDIVEFASKLRIHNPDTEIFVADDEPHDAPMLSELNMIYTKAEQVYIGWVTDLLE